MIFLFTTAEFVLMLFVFRLQDVGSVESVGYESICYRNGPRVDDEILKARVERLDRP